jgi:hypothetical protein
MLGGVLKFSILQKCVFILFFSVILIEYSGSVMGYSHLMTYQRSNIKPVFK